MMSVGLPALPRHVSLSLFFHPFLSLFPLFFSFPFLRQDLTMQPRLAWSSLCVPVDLRLHLPSPSLRFYSEGKSHFLLPAGLQGTEDRNSRDVFVSCLVHPWCVLFFGHTSPFQDLSLFFLKPF